MNDKQDKKEDKAEKVKADDAASSVEEITEVAETEAPAAEKAVTEAKPEPVAEVKPAEKPVAKAAEITPSKELTGKLAKLATEIEGLTVLEMADLATFLEEKFGVSTLAMAAPVATGATAGAAEAAPEKSTYNVVLTDAGANKLGVIKAVREIKPDLGLMDAKKLVESAPKAVAEGVKKDEADAAVKKLTEAGAKAELQ